MNSELLNVLDSIERERGVNKEILIEAIESSLVSASRKSAKSIIKQKHVSIKIDRKTGKIRAFAELTIVDKDKDITPDEISLKKAKKIDKDVNPGDTINVEVTPKDFGRIAAQTAKQVIIQKIREAERNLIFDEFKDRIGDITMGVVRHKERGNIIVDLGRTEGILPYREQVNKEHYKIGGRIRTYIVNVKSTSKGPEILLSRTHPNLVKRLFELEVPEIDDGVVEIRGIAREAGNRTKISVLSTDPKIDPVGACVGMRGSRVKNIVRELDPEKLDIIKWDPDITKYIKNALKPAELIGINVNEEEKRLEVLVAKDQLSIAIGKHGQNVRLASKLTGWTIDIREMEQEQGPKTEDKHKEQEETKEEEQEKPKTEQEKTEETETAKTKDTQEKKKISPVKAMHLKEKLGIDNNEVKKLLYAGLNSVEKIADTEPAVLSEILEPENQDAINNLIEKAKETSETQDSGEIQEKQEDTDTEKPEPEENKEQKKEQQEEDDKTQENQTEKEADKTESPQDDETKENPNDPKKE